MQKVGERRYWETWAKDVAEIARQHIVRIKGLLADESSASDRTSLGREEIVESTKARRGRVIDLRTATLMAFGGPGVVFNRLGVVSMNRRLLSALVVLAGLLAVPASGAPAMPAAVAVPGATTPLVAGPPTPFGDFNGDGWSDLLARQASTGELWLYPGNGTGFTARVRIGTGWNAMSAITRHGDFNRDGHEDVIARDSAGALWLYPGTSGGFGTRIRFGAGWNAMREITPVGDLDGDGYPDLVAVAGLYRDPVPLPRTGHVLRDPAPLGAAGTR